MGETLRLPCLQFQTVHGYRRAFVLGGQGPPLLLIHGIGDCADTWSPVIADLARDHTVLAPDLLGHGRSDKPRADYSIAAYANGMRDLLSLLDIGRVTVIGHSLGGGVAAQFAYQFPERTERLVLVDSGGVGRTVHPLIRLAALPGAELVIPLAGIPPVWFCGRVLAYLLDRAGTAIGGDMQEVLAVVEKLPDAPSRGALLRTLRCGIDWRGQAITMLDRAYLAHGVPTQLIWGTRDAIIPVEHAWIAHRALPGSRLELFADAGHFPHHSDPKRFASVVRAFVRETEPAPFAPAEWRERLRRGGSDGAGDTRAPAQLPAVPASSAT